MPTELASLYEEESARTLGVLDADGQNKRLNVKNTHRVKQHLQNMSMVHMNETYDSLKER